MTHEQAKKINQRLSKDVTTLASFKKTCDDDLKGKIEEAHRKNEIISKKLITVYGKFEEYLSQVSGGRGIYKAEHEALNEKYQDQVDSIYDPSHGLLKKLRDLQNRVRIGQKL